MVEKNVLLITRGDNGETVVIKPVTSRNNIEGLRPWIENKFNAFLAKIKTIFVEQEAGKGLSSNDFETKYKEQLDNLKSENVTNILLNGHTIESVDGTVEIKTETLAPACSDQEIEDIFNSVV